MTKTHQSRTIKQMDSLGIYVSVPFCRSKCTYCNFASGVFPASYFERYVHRLREDLDGMRARTAKWNAQLPDQVDSIYLGGGTPSLLPAALIKRLFTAIREAFAVNADAEVTIECAPGQLEEETLGAMIECGVNRISFGVQSFVDAEAKQTGRLHTRDIALLDVERVRQTGIARLNLDLIAGLPGQTRATWRESLDVLRDAAPDHASVYMLEVDDESRLGKEISAGGFRYYASQVPSDDLIAEMYVEAEEFFAVNGMPQYEISNFSRCGAESRHNLKYWTRQPYLGFGLDAHSMLRDTDGRALRFAATDELEPFLNDAGWEDPQPLSFEDELEEAWFLGLRLNRGVSLSALEADFGGKPVRHFNSVISELVKEGLIECCEKHVKLTSRGRLFSNEVFARFLREPVSA
ncbi:MAG TPA: radical SAM family heme chaperone HemW [Silvibacterium sp.]|nr:radical SAM family heme chaperone HemW [Silvibacterium sp.]